ncbi:hypothetical protein scyTo_0021119, partial [Scyliorhinus torazame]|nr:hypothetical protein [Scyliorhinus torazame]
VMDSAMPLIGEYIEEDRQLITDLVIGKMNQLLSENPAASQQRIGMTLSQEVRDNPKALRFSVPTLCPTNDLLHQGVLSQPRSGVATQQNATPQPLLNKSQSLTNSFSVTEPPQRTGANEDEAKAETIRNLRKSFASLFSD